jgi:hypothetical protein
MGGDNYTNLHNNVFRDPRITAKAKGIFGNITTHDPEKWVFSIESLASGGQMKEGVDAIAAGLRELERYSYLIRERQRDADGTLGKIIYFYTDLPAQLLDLNLPDQVIADRVRVLFELWRAGTRWAHQHADNGEGDEPAASPAGQQPPAVADQTPRSGPEPENPEQDTKNASCDTDTHRSGPERENPGQADPGLDDPSLVEPGQVNSPHKKNNSKNPNDQNPEVQNPHREEHHPHHPEALTADGTTGTDVAALVAEVDSMLRGIAIPTGVRQPGPRSRRWRAVASRCADIAGDTDYGLTVANLRRHLSVDLDGVRDVLAVWQSRLADDELPPPSRRPVEPDPPPTGPVAPQNDAARIAALRAAAGIPRGPKYTEHIGEIDKRAG